MKIILKSLLVKNVKHTEKRWEIKKTYLYVEIGSRWCDHVRWIVTIPVDHNYKKDHDYTIDGFLIIFMDEPVEIIIPEHHQLCIRVRSGNRKKSFHNISIVPEFEIVP